MEDLIARLFYVPDLIVNMVGAFTIQMTLFYLMARVLPPRSKRIYYGIGFAWTALVLFLKPVLPPVTRTVANSAATLLLPVFALKGPFVARMVIAGVGLLAETAGEVIAMLFWVGMTGLGKVDNAVLLQHLPVYVLGYTVGSMGTMILIMQGAKVMARRFGLVAEGSGDQGGDQGFWPLRYAWFVAVQLALMTAVLFIGLNYMDWAGASAPVAALLFAICFAADAGLFVQVGRAIRQGIEEERSRMLEAQVERYLSDAGRLQELLDDTARLRHDARNHRMVVETLCSRGDYGRAESYLEETLEQVEGRRPLASSGL